MCTNAVVIGHWQGLSTRDSKKAQQNDNKMLSTVCLFFDSIRDWGVLRLMGGALLNWGAAVAEMGNHGTQPLGQRVSSPSIPRRRMRRVVQRGRVADFGGFGGRRAVGGGCGFLARICQSNYVRGEFDQNFCRGGIVFVVAQLVRKHKSIS